MNDYKEIFRLKAMLEEAEIPFVFKNLYDGYQILYPEKRHYGEYDCSVVQHEFSYGHDEDLLEMMGKLLRDEPSSVEGFLSAEEAFGRIKEHYTTQVNLRRGDIEWYEAK